MLYFTSAPVPANQIPAEIMAGIKKVHGSYDEYNRKLRAAVNKDDYIEVFESVLSEEFILSLYDINITLYSGSEMAKIMGGLSAIGPEDVAALATKVNGVCYIAIDVDPIATAVANGKKGDSLLSEIVESVVEHEIVHIMQMERGDLDFTAEGVVWKGRLYSNDFLMKSAEAAKKSNDPMALTKQQLLLPWEVEAYAVSNMDKDLEFLFKGEMLKLMHRARKAYLSSISNRDNRRK